MVKLKLSSRGVKKPHKKKSIVLSLHQDLILKVAMQVAAKFSNPLEDVRSLRASCKSFWRASKEKLVGRSLAVDKESKMQWWEKDAYLALLQNCANCDNLNANFIIRVEELYNLNRANLGLQHLHSAIDGSHLNAAYFIGMVLFRHASTRSDAMKILNRVSSGDFSSRCNVTECGRSGNPVIERCRRETIEEIQKSWKRGLEMGPRVPCKHRHCGRFDDDRSGDGWVRDDQRPRAFYGQVCKSRLTSVTSSFEIFETVAVDKILMFLLRS